MKIEALFISDVHLGSKGSNADQVLDVLKQYQPEYLFLVGDIIDGWLLKRKFRWPQSHTNVIRKIMSYSKPVSKGLRDQEVERGHTKRHPILYIPVEYEVGEQVKKSVRGTKDFKIELSDKTQVTHTL
jgi:Icc-related predicted phosphoesterase